MGKSLHCYGMGSFRIPLFQTIYDILKNLCCKHKEKRRQWITLPHTSSTTEGFPQHTVEQNRRGARGENGLDPINPTGRETKFAKHIDNRRMLNSIKGFSKIELKNDYLLL